MIVAPKARSHESPGLAESSDRNAVAHGFLRLGVLAPTNDAESAIVQTLAPSLYTAIVRGANASTGVALVEVYALPPDP